MVNSHTVVFGHELDGIWFTANSHKERWDRVRRVRDARRISRIKFHACPRYRKAILTIKVISRTGRRFDILNPADIIKPLIDGAIDERILPDDDVNHLVKAIFIGERQKGRKGKPSHEIIFTFTKIG